MKYHRDDTGEIQRLKTRIIALEIANRIMARELQDRADDLEFYVYNDETESFEKETRG